MIVTENTPDYFDPLNNNKVCAPCILTVFIYSYFLKAK